MDRPLLKVAVDLVEKTYQCILDYNMMLREIDRLEERLGHVGMGLIAAYGIEAAMPKGKGTNADRVSAEAAKRERDWGRLRRYRSSVDKINRALEQIDNERHVVILECLMDGLKHKEIIAQLSVSPTTYSEWRRDAVADLALLLYEEEGA